MTTRIKLYLLDLKQANILVNIASRNLDENPYSKKYLAELKKAEKRYKKAFEKFANELSELLGIKRNNKFDLYIRTDLEKIEKVIDQI